MLLAKDIRDRERGGRAEIGVIEGDKEAASPELMKVLQDTLGRRSIIQPAVPDEVIDQQQKQALLLGFIWGAGTWVSFSLSLNAASTRSLLFPEQLLSALVSNDS